MFLRPAVFCLLVFIPVLTCEQPARCRAPGMFPCCSLGHACACESVGFSAGYRFFALSSCGVDLSIVGGLGCLQCAWVCVCVCVFGCEALLVARSSCGCELCPWSTVGAGCLIRPILLLAAIVSVCPALTRPTTRREISECPCRCCAV